MTEPDTTLPPDQLPGVRHYALVCMVALTVMMLALLLRRTDPWAVFPAFVGALGLLFRWRAGPVIVLLAVLLLLWSWWLAANPGRLVLYVWVWVRYWLAGGQYWRILLRRTPPPSRGVLPVSDLLLAVSLLTYAAGQYRLQGLLGSLFPSDSRRRRGAARHNKREAKKVDEALRRSPELVTVREIVTLLIAVVACGGLTLLMWRWLRRQETALEIADTAWQGILVLWLLGGGVLLVAGGLRYLALRRMTPAEAQLYLQDVLWHETRREQRRLNRWLAWAWLRRRRREEKEQS